MNYTTLIIAAGWLACGVGGAGFAFADFQIRDQLAAKKPIDATHPVCYGNDIANR